MATSVSGKVAFVTGGASGIGLAMAKELLTNGVKGVGIVDVSQEAGEKALRELFTDFGPNKVIFVKADITIRTELERAFESTIETFQQLDIVINNAGIINERDWLKIIAVNFTAVVEGTYLAMQKYLPKYKSGNEGIIVNTASILGINTIKTAPLYCATKHGVVGLGEALGGELFYKKYQVRVLTICPGVVKTPLISCGKNDPCLLFPEETIQDLEKLSPVFQEPERVSKGLIEVIARGKTGSLWVIEDDLPPYEVAIPERKTMKVSD